MLAVPKCDVCFFMKPTELQASGLLAAIHCCTAMCCISWLPLSWQWQQGITLVGFHSVTGAGFPMGCGQCCSAVTDGLQHDQRRLHLGLKGRSVVCVLS